MKKPSTILLALLALSTISMSVTGGSRAHSCSSVDPAYNCGACVRDENGDETHKHTYDNGDLYCESAPCHWKEGCPDDVSRISEPAVRLPVFASVLLRSTGAWGL